MMCVKPRRARWTVSTLVAIGWLSGPGVGAAQTNRILAVVNDEVITESEANARMSAFLKQQDDPHVDETKTSELLHAVLQRLIEERLIIREAKRLAVTVSADEVTERLKAIRKQFEPKARYEAMLQEAHMTEEQLRVKVREQLLVQRTIDGQVRSKIVMSPSELHKLSSSAPAATGADPAALEEVQAYHLLIRVTPQRSAQEVEALVNQLYQQLLHGADIAELAKRYSDDPQAQGGGLLEWTPRGQLLPELDEVLFRLQPGALSAPIKTRLGYHLVKVVAHRQPAASDASEAQQQRLEGFYQEKFGKAMREWLDGLTQRAYIQVMDDP